MSDELHLDERIISQAAQASLSNQVEDAENVNVEVHTDFVKAVQGKADSVSVNGQDMVVQDIHMQEVTLQTDRVAVNPLSLLLGDVKLDHPIDATAHVVLTEADLNRAMNAEAVASRIPPLKLDIEGNQVPVELLHPVTVKLPVDGKISLDGEALLHEPTGTRRVGFYVVIVPRTNDHPVLLEAFECDPGEGITIAFTIALMQKFQELLAQPYYELEGMAFRVKSLSIQSGKMTIETEAHIPQIPSL